MHTNRLRQADLNLLVVLAVLDEERNISKAAERLLLSQPAVSRALQRLRLSFGDELLVRGGEGYELTPYGKRIIRELEVILPRIDKLLRGTEFDPKLESVTFRVTGTDYALKLFAPPMTELIVHSESKTNLDFLPWTSKIHEDIDFGHIDLAFHANDGTLPGHIMSEVLFKEDLVCVVGKGSPYKNRLTLKQYSEAEHVIVSLFEHEQTMPDKGLAKLGVKRKARLRVPYFGSAIDSVTKTDLVATIPRRFVMSQKIGNAIRIIEAPKEIESFDYLMTWHSRLTTDAANEWLRAQVRGIAKDIVKKR